MPANDGTADLDYSLQATDGFIAPVGVFLAVARDGGNEHVIVMDTATAGPMSGTSTFLSNAPDEPIRTVALTGEVLAPIPGDLDQTATSISTTTPCSLGA